MSFLQPSLFVLASLTLADTPGEVDYLRDVKPVLAGHCFACHGAIKQKGGLRVDTAVAILEGGDNGPAVVPGKSGASLLIEHVLGANGLRRMPPEDDSDALKPAQIAVLRKWIDQGAKAPPGEKPEADPREHWAFKTPVRPAVPAVKEAGWVRNPIDAFIAAEHERHGLKRQPEIDRALLLRRVYLDLVGLPPTREEIDAFVNSATPAAAYEAVVEKLLSSPQYGERWGRHWMDVWRYSDWWGLGAELRNSQRHIWHWRDWVVESLNRDKGYDRMVLEMLAADELFPTDANALRGTGFLARHYFLFNRTTWLDETIEHTGKAFLGLTMNCAKCHDHKYDPVSQVDYYRFRAIFEPYQLRLDQVPGETDFMKNGVPRVFDANLDAPTYVHVRGNEQNVDKSRTITPGLPKLLAPAGLEIQRVKLPPEGHTPGLRPFVLRDLIAAEEKRRDAAKQELVKTRALLAKAEKAPAEPAAKSSEPAKVLASDDFATLSKERWDVGPGTWAVDGGKVVQRLEGSTRAVLSLKQAPPADFEAKFKFAILGGQVYYSVGIAFDVDGSKESLVYLTAHKPDPRVQFAYNSGGGHVYPADAKQPRKVPLKQSHEMTLRVRGTVLNVAIDGEHAFALHLPNGRHPGKLDLITFDAGARFEQFTLSTLPPDVALVTPGNKPGQPLTTAQAEKAIAAAEKAIIAAEKNLASLQARAAADRAAADGKDVKELARTAARAEKDAAVAQAELALARAEEQQAKAGGKDAAVKQAKAALDTARKALANPGETYTPVQGALKTASSNLESEESRRKPFPKESSGRRSALARWIADRNNPLTARVAVNHVWARHFGQPLVPSVFDFGRKGAAPTHPELLDWLAVEFMDSGWSMKHLHKLIVTSAAYRMTSSTAGAAPANRERDADNRHLWRMNAGRMEAQVVRDSLLHLAGELDPALGGPPVEAAQQEASRRRSLYFFHSAIERNRFLTTFDDADPLDCYRRRESIVPQQALALENSKLALAAAQKIADRLEIRLAKVPDREFAREAFVTVLALTPSAEELTTCEEALGRWRDVYRSAPDAGGRARVQLVHALLNHNEFVTIR